MTDKVKKVAADKAAKDYWTKYFKSTGYGALWVRDIPRKIKAALAPAVSKKTAGLDEAEVQPIAHVITDDYVMLEGRVRVGKQAHLFAADFDHEGNLKVFTTIQVG